MEKEVQKAVYTIMDMAQSVNWSPTSSTCMGRTTYRLPKWRLHLPNFNSFPTDRDIRETGVDSCSARRNSCFLPQNSEHWHANPWLKNFYFMYHSSTKSVATCRWTLTSRDVFYLSGYSRSRLFLPDEFMESVERQRSKLVMLELYFV